MTMVTTRKRDRFRMNDVRTDMTTLTQRRVAKKRQKRLIRESARVQIQRGLEDRTEAIVEEYIQQVVWDAVEGVLAIEEEIRQSCRTRYDRNRPLAHLTRRAA